MELNDAIIKRRSVRQYLEKKVSRDLVEKIIESANLAPTSCNLQLTKYVIVDDLEILQKLSDHVSYKFSYSPCIIVVVRDARFIDKERNADALSSAMSAENILLRAVDLGLSACPMVGFGHDDIIKNILNIPKFYDIVMIISVGYEDTTFLPSSRQRLNSRDTFSYNTFDDLSSLTISPDLSDHSISSLIEYRKRIAPVYLDRFRLNTFDINFYTKVFDLFSESVLSKLSSKSKVLDVMSYDGVFAEMLHKKYPNFGLVISDYLENNRNFISGHCHCQAVPITEDNNFVDVGKVSVATLIFQSPFIPRLDLLLKNVNSVLEQDGYFFIAYVEDFRSKRFIKWLKKIWKSWVKNESFNIYNNNPFYKNGPSKFLSLDDHRKLLKQSSFVIEKETTIPYYTRGLYIRTIIAKKMICFQASNSFTFLKNKASILV